MFDNKNAVERALSFLGAALEAQAAGPYELVVVGGAAMSVLDLGVRPTKDVDVLGLRETPIPNTPTRDHRPRSTDIALTKHKPLPAALLAAAVTVAGALGLDSDWLNAGPADLLDHGLPEGFEQRLVPKRFGPLLVGLLRHFECEAAAEEIGRG